MKTEQIIEQIQLHRRSLGADEANGRGWQKVEWLAERALELETEVATLREQLTVLQKKEASREELRREGAEAEQERWRAALQEMWDRLSRKSRG